LPDGKNIEGDFNEEDTLFEVKKFVSSKYSKNVNLMTTYPKCVYEDSDLASFTLKDLGKNKNTKFNFQFTRTFQNKK